MRGERINAREENVVNDKSDHHREGGEMALVLSYPSEESLEHF